MINVFELSFIPGIMFGIEFPDISEATIVIDIGIIRFIWYRIDPKDLEDME